MPRIRHRVYTAITGANRVRFFLNTVLLKKDVFDFIVHASQLINEDFLQGQGQHVKIRGLARRHFRADLLGLPPDDQGL